MPEQAVIARPWSIEGFRVGIIDVAMTGGMRRSMGLFGRGIA